MSSPAPNGAAAVTTAVTTIAKPKHTEPKYPVTDPSDLHSTYLAHRSYIDAWTRYYAARGVLTATDYVEHQCREFANKPAIEFVGDESLRLRPITYSELNQLANRLASYWLSIGVSSKTHGTVCVLVENSPFFLVLWLSLAKLGITAALLNTGLKDKQLRHSINISAVHGAIVQPKDQVVIVSETYRQAWEQTRLLYEAEGIEAPKVYWTRGAKINFSAILQPEKSAANASLEPSIDFTHIEQSFLHPTHIADSSRSYSSHRSHIHWESPLFLISTSGTTGPSKAAIFSQRRFVGAGVTWAYPMALREEDRYYIVLPLYHGNGGVVAVSACMHVGCRMVIREKFSTSNFWADVRLHGCTAMVYVGELWRYLHTAPPSSSDFSNPLRVIAGNGLRSDIWQSVCERFGIERVVEHYGMTEMPAGPYMNFYGRLGACGYIPPSIRAAQGADKLVSFDVEEGKVERDRDTGYCIELTTPSTPGEALFLLAPSPSLSSSLTAAATNPHTDGGECDKETGLKDPLGNELYRPYRNYTSLAAAEKRVYRNVFSPLDAWFATGDLLKLDSDGFFYFCDRIGDTYRWKGENVATNDVAEVLCAYAPPSSSSSSGANQAKIREANVYGVEWPGQDGKAGMACLVLNPAADAASSSASSTASSQISSASSSIDLSALLSYLLSSLPSFANPAFLRIKPLGSDNTKTSTLKFQKVLAQSQGFNPALCEPEDELWYWPGAKLGKQQQQAMAEKGERLEYVRITQEVYQQIVSGAR